MTRDEGRFIDCGPNGAGKSTLFNIILHTGEPDAWTVERDEWTMIGDLPREADEPLVRAKSKGYKILQK